ncbi:aminotransferase class I/II-fold pyridoxal phosphate-dependent enzyme [Actinomadura macrotermitis]|uniref:L-lactate dehydrogenase n=1 Tax=Actinomadura macrotermitis TaxID=2585200 RepID=A0A7K0BP94_9ACTN|nr:aminotransferase class I/II-fold pyridoxal phosphate-dependent enzyme [Actinomadura macrotermitis]MQY03020.1 L-lactate dehydrogenase [Actinomadura macrotermitis]
MELNLADYARRAREVLDPGVWDFFEGGAGEESTLAANLAAFDRIRLRPSVLRGVGGADPSLRLFGRTLDAPIGIAPLAYQTMAHPSGEVATARGVSAAGRLPMIVSTFAGRALEEIADAAGGPLWLQVYCLRDREATRGLIERAERAGLEALVLTVDAPHLGRRLRDLRNDFRLPPGLVPANLVGDGEEAGGYASPGAHARAEFAPALDWSVIDWIRSVSPLPLLLKGVLTGRDAARAVDAGVEGIVVSNHGGRQLDGAPATLEVLPEIAAAVASRIPVLLDGGVRRGRDVLAARALGADAVLVGRPVLHGLAAAGEEGVTGVLRLLLDELTDAMTLAGLARLPDRDSGLVAPGPEAAPARPGDRVAFQPHLPGVGGMRRELLHASLSDPLLDTMNFLNEITHRHPKAISFAPGRPYDGFFETEQVFTHIRRYLDHLAERGDPPARVRDALFQYGPSAGIIREIIAGSLRADEDIDVPPESIVVTVGAQEAMLLTLRALISGPGDAFFVSSPCYVGIAGAARLLEVEITPVRERAGGLDCADLEAAIHAERARGRRPKAVYVIPDHANPSGVSLSLQTRLDLLALAARHELLILEDSPYRLVSPGERTPTLKSLDRDRRVVHLGSFAKTVFPGARTGFAVADQVVLNPDGSTGLLAAELAKIKSMVTVNTSPLGQAAVAGALLAAGGRLAELNRDTAAHYGDALRHTLECLEERLPPERRAELGVEWNRPSGGFFLTLRTPFPADNDALARSAQDFGVIWTPMSYFYPEGGGEDTLRLAVSYLTHTEIEEGVDRLASFIESHRSEPR